ncbi:MAG: PHP domain-containing protein [Desulfobacterales bacterium]
MGYKSGNIDLHIHSSASDGSLSPEQILSHALESGLAAIAITDHDTLEGSAAVLRQGIPDNLDFLTGVEISAEYPPGFDTSGSMHILGYGISPQNPHLNHLLEKQQHARISRNPGIIKKLNSLGIQVTLEEIGAEAGRQEIARPHIASHLVRKGYAADVEDAFNRYLAKGKPAYVDKFKIPAEQAAAAIDAAGGIAVLAHPGLLPESIKNCLEKFITTLKSMGICGIEVYYPGHGPEQISHYENLAEKFGLLVTGGTDFHGDINQHISMGKGLGDMAIPYSVFRRILQALDSKKHGYDFPVSNK